MPRFPLRFSAVALALLLAAGCDATDPLHDQDTAQAGGTAEATARPSAGTTSRAAGVARAFRCDQIYPVTRPEYYRSVTGTIVNGVPTDVLVFRRFYPSNHDSYRQLAEAMPDGYWPPRPGMQPWDVTGHPPGDPDDDYVLLLPERLIRRVFTGELHVWYNHGGSGWAPSVQSCRFL